MGQATVVVVPTAESRATAALRGAILAGELGPGRRVNQEEWADRTGVSAIPVREALRALAGEGLLTYRPRRGYVVTELSLAELEEVYALRRTLETEALVRGVPVAGKTDVAALEAAADAYLATAAAGDIGGQLAANRVFHGLLHGLARSRPLERLIDHLWDSTEAYRALYYALPGETDEADRAHRALVAAVADGDAGRAVAAQDAHRERALGRLRSVITA